jgi:hypothetical protein
MLIRQICDVKNNEIIIHLPDTFSHGKEVMVIIDNAIMSKEEKIALIKQAASDPLFQADVKEVHEDFDALDQDLI